MAESGVFGADDALADAETRWREIAIGSGGTGDSSNSSPTPDVLSSFIISGGRGFSQDDSGDSFDGLVPAMDAHYYRGYWAGVQLAMYAPQPLPSAPAPYPIPGYGPSEPFPIPRFESPEPPAGAPPLQRAMTRANPHPLGEYYVPYGLKNPWPSEDQFPPWIYNPEDPLDDWNSIEDPRMRLASSSFNAFSPIKGKMSDVSPFPQYLSPGQLQQYQDVNPELAPDANPDDFVPFMVETFREATGQVSAPFGIDPFTGSADADITPGNVNSDVTPRGDWAD